VQVYSGFRLINDMNCYREGIEWYKEYCYEVDEYSMKYLYLIGNACEENVGTDVIQSVFDKICK